MLTDHDCEGRKPCSSSSLLRNLSTPLLPITRPKDTLTLSQDSQDPMLVTRSGGQHCTGAAGAAGGTGDAGAAAAASLELLLLLLCSLCCCCCLLLPTQLVGPRRLLLLCTQLHSHSSLSQSSPSSQSFKASAASQSSSLSVSE